MNGGAGGLAIRAKDECKWDLVSLGEVMLRFDPGDDRIAAARSFRVREGGGEYNVARGLKRCFGLDTAVVTALVDNAVGRLVQDLVYQGGVDQSHVRWVKDDGVGRTVRNGLNFTERGFGIRGAVGCSDRGNTAASQLKPGDIDWDKLFGKDGVRWLHTGGIFAALSETTASVAEEAMKAAKKHGKQPDPRSLEAAKYILLLTSLPADAFPPADILALYRFRWQIELAFKRFKSLAGLDMLPAKKPELARAWIYARLIVAIIAEQIAGQVPDSSPSGLDNANDNPIALAPRENSPGYDLRRHSWTTPVADRLQHLQQNPPSSL